MVNNMIIWRRMVVPKYGVYREFEIHTMITQDDYIPIATATELNALRNATAQTFGSGSKWEGTYTSGLDKKYVLIDDIDLDVAPYNEGEGWVPISVFAGVFDGAGRFGENLYINRPTQQRAGLFGYVGNNARVKNLFVYGIVHARDRLALIAGNIDAADNAIIENCAAAGRVIGYRDLVVSAGGAVGWFVTNEVDCKVLNFSSFASVLSIEAQGRMGGAVGTSSGGIIENSFSVGSAYPSNLEVGGLVGRNTGSIANSYYNTQTSGQSDTAKGMGRTTAQLLGMGAKGPEWEAGTYYLGDTVHIGDIVHRCNVASTAQEPPHADWTVTDAWDTTTWEFKPDRYPIQRIFGEQAVHRAPPVNVVATPDGDDIVLTWDDAATEVDLPDGYFVYQSIGNGPWTKLNATAVTDKTYTVTGPLAAGEYNYFVTAFYNDAGYKIKETGNSATTTETIA